MFINAQSIEEGSVIETDLCIIGAGAAGITMALEFASESLSVHLVESGDEEYSQPTQDLYKGNNTGLPYYPLESSRLRFFGGTTNHWSGWCRPLDEVDFLEHDHISHSGWPISLDIVRPYYHRAQSVCELGNYVFHPDQPFPKETLKNTLWRKSTPTRFGSRYRTALANASNISVLFNSNVTQIRTNLQGDAISLVEIKTLASKAITVRAKAYVLSTGGIENARLLLASNTQNPKGLGNTFDQVGRYFMLHPQLNIGTLHADSQKLSPYLSVSDENRMYADGRIRSGFYLSPEVQKTHRVGNHGVIVHHPILGKKEMLNLYWHDWTHKNNTQHNIESTVSQLLRQFGEDSNHPRSMSLQLRMNHLPNPDSRVKLTKERDALGMQKIELDWRTTANDFDGVKKTAELIACQISSAGLGRVRLNDWLYSPMQQWPDDTIWDFHHMGTTRMSSDPQKGVVDKNCKVHDLKNLYVAGSSVFTTAGFSNPTMTIVALAIRLADTLKSTLSR